jgi:hypothetical protein
MSHRVPSSKAAIRKLNDSPYIKNSVNALKRSAKGSRIQLQLSKHCRNVRPRGARGEACCPDLARS